jgi:hypothetical protein
MIETAIKRSNKATTLAIIVGMILYLLKYSREYFANNNLVLSILGFLPNLGLAYAIPFIYVSNRIRTRKPVKHFEISCLITFLLMFLNEIRDKYQVGRVFDMFDIYASLAGVLLAYLVFQLWVRKDLMPHQ